MPFEFLDHTADLKIRATADSFSKALEQASKALFVAIAEDSVIVEKIEKKIEIKIHKEKILVHDFLTELLILFATEDLLLSRFEIDIKESMGFKLEARVFGEEYDETRHKLVKEVKAITYHDMVVEKRDGGWVIEVVCDT